MLKALAFDGEISVTVMDTADMVNESIKIHKLSPVAAAAFGRTMTACTFMASGLKNKEDKLYVNINGDGVGGRITVCGNVKYDALSDTPAKVNQVKELLEKLGWQGNALLVLGSTHPQEETMLFRAAPDIIKTGTKIIFAPRHLERKSEIEHTLEQNRLHYAFISQDNFDKNTDILCADVMGLLQSLYACATLTFVGGSVAPRGAHNLLEPAILGKTVLFGKHFYNTPDTAHALLERGGGVLVSENNFKETVLRLLADREQLDNMNTKARQTALSFKGATDKIRGVVEQYAHRKKS